jgi:hypothetical protein
MKNLLNIKGAQKLSKQEQNSITGGGLDCSPLPDGTRCNGLGWKCCNGVCSNADPCYPN